MIKLGKIILRGVSKLIPSKIYVQLFFYRRQKKFPNLKNPRTYNEKLLVKKLHDRNPLYTKLVDKIKVRDYVRKKVGDEYLIPLLGVWNNVKDIDFRCMPERFVLKCNHDSGSTVICYDKSNFNMDACKKKIKKSLRTNYYWIGREWAYKNVERKVLAEQYISEADCELRDYKIFCFHGRAHYIQVDLDRHSNHTRNIYDRNWNLLNVSIEFPTSKKIVQKPDNLSELLSVAEKLSEDLTDARVDLYNVDGKKILFGEITLYHGNGSEIFKPASFEYEMGKLI